MEEQELRNKYFDYLVGLGTELGGYNTTDTLAEARSLDIEVIKGKLIALGLVSVAIEEEEEETECCDRCRRGFNASELQEVSRRWHRDRIEHFCQDCYDEVFIACYSCGEVIEREYSLEYGDEHYCEDCFNDSFFYCDHCGDTYDREDAYYDDDDNIYCGDCYDRYAHSDCIHDYHYKPRQIFYGVNSVTSSSTNEEVYLGVELEMEFDSSDVNDTAEKLVKSFSKNEELFHLEHDGSLDSGFELVTRPCTVEYHKNKFPWNDICRVFANTSADASNSCGMHVHFNKRFFDDAKEVHTIKLLYLFERFWDNFVLFSRRKDERAIRSYCAKYNDDFSVKCSSEIPEKVRRSQERGRYFAINLQNQNTIEFRLWASSTLLKDILSTIEMCDFLVRYVKTATIKEVQAIMWWQLKLKVKKSNYPNLYSVLRQ